MKHLELHILQSFPVACLNRDDLNSPKTAIFGGVQRARVSSQSWKRAIREYAQENSERFKGQRTRLLAHEIKQSLVTKKCEEQRAVAFSMCLAHYLAKVDTKNIEKVKTLTFFSPEEINKLADVLLALDASDADALVDSFLRVDLVTLANESDEDDEVDETAEEKTQLKKQKSEKGEKKLTAKAFGKKVSSVLKSPVGKAFRGKGAVNVKDAADIALFGRMVANDHSLTLEAASMFAHALSTHKVDNEIDFFTAVDDLQPEEESGAGMTGTLEFNSATYYRFAALNLDMLKQEDHLAALSSEERKQVVRTFIEATLLAIPGARKNSMNAYTRPGYVLGIVRSKGHPIQLVNAFEKPIRSFGGKSVFESSLDALKAENVKLNKTWGLDKPDCQMVSAAIPDVDLAEFLNQVVEHVD